MNLTNRLKQWCVENADVKATATDDEFKKAVSENLLTGKLAAKLYADLTETKEDKEANAVLDALKGLGEGQNALLAGIKALVEKAVAAPAPAPVPTPAPELEKKTEPETKAATPPTQKAPKGTLEKLVVRLANPGAVDDEKTFDIRVKEAAEQYSDEKSAKLYPKDGKKGAHPLAGMPIKDWETERTIDNPSDRDKAVVGAYCKFVIQSTLPGMSRSKAFASLLEHDRELLCYAMDKGKWSGSSRGDEYSDIKGERLTDGQKATLIDDATSGGLEAAPIVFDDMVIEAPLLYGELFPLVQRVNINRGRRIEGVAVGKVTASWGGVDDTAISLFDSTSYVSAFDTTIHRWQGAMKVGLDFLSDTPIEFGAIVTRQYGERLLEDLDDVITSGDGTTQPEGIFTKSGTTSVTWSSTTSLGNYESLRAAIDKQEFKTAGNSAVFVGTDTSYFRARAIPVGASDARRLGGTLPSIGGINAYDTYTWLDGLPYKINESINNTKVAFAVMNKYRMYIRRGLTFRSSTEGQTLIRENNMLITCTARMGGSLTRGAVAAKTTDAPA